ncbi:MAG: HD family phosphohydrolase [Dehalococcoidia bacterium]
MLARPPAPTFRFSSGASVFLGFVVAAGVLLAVFPWYPLGNVVAEGDRAPWTLTSPRALSFDSAIRTEQVRAEAAAAVPDVFVLDPTVRDRQLTLLDSQLSAIRGIRDEPGLAASARESAIRAVRDVELSPAAAATFASATAAEWETMVTEATAALGRALSGTLQEQDLPAAREQVSGFLSPFLSPAQISALTELLSRHIVSTLVVDSARTNALRAEARQSTPPVHVSRARGDVLVTEGQQLTAADIELLEEAGLQVDGVRVSDVLAVALLAAVAGTAVGGYVLVTQPASLASARRVTLLVLLLVLPAFAMKLALSVLLPDQDRHFVAYALPVAAAPMAAAVLLDVGLGILLSVLLAIIAAFVSVMLPLSHGVAAGEIETARLALAVSASSLAGVYVAARAERLHRYLVAGLASGAAAGAALLMVWLVEVERGSLDLLWMAMAVGVSGVLAALIAVGVFVLFSRPFGIITRVELMELTQLSHPLLRRLQDEAPGTFQHSILVGNLAERAAERIGADPLLVRIGSYYHDIGKLVAPPFFIENSGEESPHQPLDPLQSTRVILQHVTAGVEIARREGLPDAVVQFIPQHHGTRLVTYFYRRAASIDPDIDPEMFRYPGPKPQSRETALVMLADSAEATVRASADRSADRIRSIVEAVIRERLEEGQFDESPISMRDLRAVTDVYSSILNSVYHPRVQYPEPTARELASRRGVSLTDTTDSEGPRWPRLPRPRAQLPAGPAPVEPHDTSEDGP